MIQVADNFNYRGKKPNFDRDSFDTLQSMKNYSDNNIDEGHISYCIETDKHYKYNSSNDIDSTTGKFRQFTEGILPDEEDITSNDNDKLKLADRKYNPEPCIQYMSEDSELNGRNIIFDNCFFYSTAVPLINGIIYRKCDINIGNSNNFAIDIQKYINGSYIITGGAFVPLLVDSDKSVDTSIVPSYSYNKYRVYAYNNDKYNGDFTYSENREESFAYAFSDNPNTISWCDFEPANNNIIFNDYTLIEKGKTLTLEFYYDSENKGDINCYLLIFKKIKGDSKTYKSVIYLTKELHNSIFNNNKFILVFGDLGCIGSKWEEYNGELKYVPLTRIKGTFDQKPTSGIQQGFAYFCTDKQTTEGSRDGIMIYYAGDNTWVDALGRIVS